MNRLLAVAAACCAIGVHAQKACSPADMQKAQKAADNVVTWQHLNKAWKDYRQCDTGANHASRDSRPWRAERDTNADLARALRDGVPHHAVQANRRKR